MAKDDDYVNEVLGIKRAKPPKKLTEEKIRFIPGGTAFTHEPTKEAREFYSLLALEKAMLTRVPHAPVPRTREKITFKRASYSLYPDKKNKDDKNKGEDFER